MRFILVFIGLGIIITNSIAQNASVNWPLTSTTTVTPTVSNNLLGQDESFSNLTINNYSGPNSSQRVTTLDGSWSAETNQNNSRFIQFAVSPSSGYTFYISAISLNLGASGGGNMKANIWYSTDSTFSVRTQLNSSVLNLPNGTLSSLSYSPNIVLNSGSTFYLRIYPWYTSSATGKYVCPNNLVISGSAEPEASPVIILTPTTLIFGNVNIQTFKEKSYSISGTYLAPLSGNITINAPEGFEISKTSGSGYSNSVEFLYENGTLESKTVYVRFSPNSTSTYSGYITNSGGGTTQSLSVSGTGVTNLITSYYVSGAGSDTNPGTIDQPFLTIPKAVSVAQLGDTIYVRGGTYSISSTITISKSGITDERYFLLGYSNERPILDFSTGSSIGILLSGNYWHIKGFDVLKAKGNGMRITGSNNIIEFCAFYDNSETGLQLASGASFNRVINCDAYFNYDPPLGGNADGFAPKLDVGTGNYFYGCRSWQNSDDGWDGYMRGADNVTTTIENSWCFMNGYLKDGSPITSGNGNGFKMGGGDNSNADSLRHNMILKNCIAFDNRVKGFDQNNNRGSMTLYNNTAYRNGTNYGMGAGVKIGETMTLINCLVLGSTGSIWTGAIRQTNSWMSPFTNATTADFISIDTTGVRGPRKLDGSLPDISFMRLAANSQFIDAGTEVGIPYNGIAPDLGYIETEGSTSVINNFAEQISTFKLFSNFPNPFNPITNFEFQIANREFVSLTIYDILGREIIKLVNDVIEAGIHKVQWNATNLPSGVYFSVLENGKVKKILKLALLK